nr:BTAD domain-containing putative transcriptional regulator [Mycobacterium paraense]
MELEVLGPLQVRQVGLPVAIPGAKPRAILTMLGLHDGSVVSSDSLVELLWGDDPPRTAAKALQTHISLLRRTLGEGFVLTQGTGWTLAETEVDAARYLTAARLGRDAAAAGDDSRAVVCFDEALALWRGIPELPDGRRGTPEKTRWIEAHAALVEDRADALLATGRAAEIVGELEAAVADAPLRERRWGQLMLALYRAGRQGEALGAYQRARALLADELGVDPGPNLRRLEALIVAQDAALEVPSTQRVSSVTRAVTFLLTDIEGSTAAWEADAGAMAVALARHDELVEQIVTSRGGRLIKTRGEGDATFSVFDRPSAAAAAAIELQDAIAHEPWALSDPMRVRVALHTGEAELRDGDYFGRAVNRAARLRSLAVGGQILCSGATAELVIDSLPDHIVLADLGRRELRNLARPEHVFELRLATAGDQPQPASPEVPMERPALPAVLAGPGPFVGRGTELQRLFSAWQTALAGATNAVLIAGEPGVGKTRLAGEWSRQAYDQGALVIYGRCDEDLGAPYQPFAEALRALLPCLGAGGLRGLRGVEALLALVPGLTDILPDLAAPTRADPDTERYALFDAVVAVLGVASASAPVVLILDDLHWAAKPTLLLLRHLLRFGEQARVQIIGTYRSTDLDRSHPLAAMLADLHRDGSANRIQLSGLDEDDVTAYVAEAGYHDEELARALASVTGGNPFFLIEALRHVDESGGRWDQSTLPQGVREAVSRRLTRLLPETNKALAAAAVVGSRFDLELVERVVGDDLVDAFDEACKAGIVIEEPGGRYRFNHALVRQSLLAELPSVRRMRLHQRIATTLESQPGADDELLAELAHHYFECAWAGNAAKAVEYCRRAADQAMARLAYEGAADLYDHALHALEEIDDELPDRDDQTAELLVARCEALLAAGDVASAAGAVSQLQGTTVDSARLAAWATCFDGQLSMLIHPERLDEIEAALSAAAGKLAELDDAAGEAKAHTVRAGCLARLGRIGDCEVALDDALTAARRAREHRRVNNVLANAPLAALWGPNPVPRAGGRCLDVVRLLRITTDSPAVEATSTRCQAVLEAFRGRAAAARRMIDSARRTVTELGLRHALLEVEQFAGIVELVVDDPAAAEGHLLKAYIGFRRMGLDADTAETAALLGRAYLALDRDAEADELCSESERLAGHALKPSIAWRTLRAQLLARAGDHGEARRVAEAAVSLAERTDALVDHGDACLTLARVLGAAGDVAGARAAAERAADLYERKGAAALAERARGILGERDQPVAEAPPEAPNVELDNAAALVGERVMAAIHREAWDEVEQLFAPDISIDSRRKVVGLTLSSEAVLREMRRELELGTVRINHVMVAARGDRLALSRLMTSSPDGGIGAPQDELLQLYAINDEGRVAWQVWFDVEDLDAALAELDARYAAGEAPAEELDNACVRAGERMIAALDRRALDEIEHLYSPHALIESRRKIVGFTQTDLPSDFARANRPIFEAGLRVNQAVIAVRGGRLALSRMRVQSADASPGGPYDEFLSLYGIDEEGRFSLQVWFDVEDLDAALAELDAAHARFEDPHPPAHRVENAAARVFEHVWSHFAAHDWDALADTVADNYVGVDHRRVVSAETQYGRGEVVRDLQAAAGVGFTISMLSAMAIRGERLVLARVRASGRDPEAIQNDALNVVEIDGDERIAHVVTFDLDAFDAAITELDARYAAGEAAEYSRTWTVISGALAAHNRREIAAATQNLVTIDHRRVAAFAPGEGVDYIRAGWDLDQKLDVYIESVHRLSQLGAVFTWAGNGGSYEGFVAEWRGTDLMTVNGEMLSRVEVFEEADIDAALARFDQLSLPARRPENAASRAFERMQACFTAGDWDALADTLVHDFHNEDRRRVVNAGILRGRGAAVETMRQAAELGITHATSTVIATRGQRLVLAHARFSQGDEYTETFQADALQVAEIGPDEHLTASILFDADDMGSAMAELDARYLAGEAAAYSRTWSAITQAYAALNRRELPPTTPDWVNIDHRRGTSFASGEMPALLDAAWNLTTHLSHTILAVHRLNDLGAVLTNASRETSQEGFDAEWRVITVGTVEGDVLNRCEIFDEDDLDAAIVHFEELSRPTHRLENPASRVTERLLTCFEARDWDAFAAALSGNISTEDRRHVVNAGIRQDRDAELRDFRLAADLGVTDATSEVVATRGERVVLTRLRLSRSDEKPDAFRVDLLWLVEIDADRRVAAWATFDTDDFAAAVAELDARYLAGEAAAHAHTWSFVTSAYAAFDRRKVPARTPDCVYTDHRRVVRIEDGGLGASLRALWEQLTPQAFIYIESVHRLTDLGAVVTHTAHATSREGFDAEWREVNLLTAEGDLVNRCELFDEADIDAALARLDELSSQTRRLENAASQAGERFLGQFAAGNWDAMPQILADNFTNDDRRRVVGVGLRTGRDAQIADMRTIADLFSTKVTLTPIATRGPRLALVRLRFSAHDHDSEAFVLEAAGVLEVDADERIVAVVFFDVDNIEAALKELDARYLAGDAAAHSHAWSIIASSYTALNQHELPPTTPDCVNIDHRRETAFGPGDVTEYIRAGWDLDQDIHVYVERVHALASYGAVITYAANETAHGGFAAEWRGLAVLTVDGDLVNRVEVFDDADVAPAIARFEQLSRPTPRLENAASQAYERFRTCFAARDWAAMAEVLTADTSVDDHRRVVNAEMRRGRDVELANMRAFAEIGAKTSNATVIATRGERLVLCRTSISSEDQQAGGFLIDMLIVVESSADKRILARVAYDPDDIDAAFAELDARYLAGEAAAQAQTWSVVAGAYAAMNRHELFATTSDWVNRDHRRPGIIEDGDLNASLRSLWELIPDITFRIEAVHRLTDLGVVCSHVAHGVSRDGFDAEWRGIEVITTEGHLINRCEIFDAADLEAAIAHFDELQPPPRRFENAASKVAEQFSAHFAVRNWDAMEGLLAADVCTYDRRRVVNDGIRRGRDVEMANWRATADVWLGQVTATIIATRGKYLALLGLIFTGQGEPDDPFSAEALAVIEINGDGRIATCVVFDTDDTDAAFDELEVRYLSGEAAPYARVWKSGMDTVAELNRHEPGPNLRQLSYVDHRKIPFASGPDFGRGVEELWALVPDAHYRVPCMHALDSRGTVVTFVIEGTDKHGNELQWRRTLLFASEGPLLEVYEDADLDAALARFEELRPQPPRLENAASQVTQRFLGNIAAGDWDAIGATVADGFFQDDRRRVVGAGVRHGRDAEIADLRAIADHGITDLTSTVMATRGERLVLVRCRFAFRDEGSEAFLAELLGVAEINANEQVVAAVSFDLHDIDAAFEELDARYLAGEAAPYARAWQTTLDIERELNRHESGPMIKRLAYADHRRVPFADGDFRRGLEELWLLVPDARYRVQAVHALDVHGIVASHIIEGTDAHGNELQWVRVFFLASEGPRLEIYEEDDLEAALARFEELRPQPRRLENMAIQADRRFWACFAARDWDAMAELLADDVRTDDRRRVVNAGVRHGRDNHVAEMRAVAEMSDQNVESTVIAIRGERLALTHVGVVTHGVRPEEVSADVLNIVEIGAGNRIVARIGFDIDDVDAAFEELDARYLAGEAAACSQTWTAMMQVQTVYNRHALPPTTKDLVNIDHRRGRAFSPDDAIPFLRASYDVVPNLKGHIEAVHRLSDFGAVVTEVMTGTSQEGFDAEWREIGLFAFDGELVCRFELFDEHDLDAALTRFDELQPPDRRPENAASRLTERFFAYAESHQWGAMAEIVAEDSFFADRRRVVNFGIWRGRGAVSTNMRVLDEVEASMSLTVIATRGERLALTHVHSLNRDLRHGEFDVELLSIVEADADSRIATLITFDCNDIDAASAELDARYLAGEAAAHAHTWSTIAGAYAAMNRHEVPAVTPDWVNIDHRRGASFAPGEMPAYIRATFDVAPDVTCWIESVHRLTHRGAVITHAAHGTSQQGFGAEWRYAAAVTVEGDKVNRCELFDEADLDAALARFDELDRPPLLENAATRSFVQIVDMFNRRDLDSLLASMIPNGRYEHRRKGMRDLLEGPARQKAARALFETAPDSWLLEVEPIAIRGSRVALIRERFRDTDPVDRPVAIELLCVVDISDDGSRRDTVSFDPDDMDAAFAELDARYLAGEAAAHAQMWSVLMRAFVALNRREVPAITPDWVRIDHRSLAPFEAGDWATFLHATWDVTPNLTTYIEAVHRLSDLGAVVTHASHGTSQDGMDAEWRIVDIFTVDGERVSGAELFDEADLDAALARFDELNRSAVRLENAATRIWSGLADAFNRRDLDGFLALTTTDLRYEDRRKGLRHEFEGPARRKNMQAMFEAAPSGSRLTVETIAIRGQRLSLTRAHYRDPEDPAAPTVEMLQITEVSREGLLQTCVSFDPDDMDGALAELTARWADSGEEAGDPNATEEL